MTQEENSQFQNLPRVHSSQFRPFPHQVCFSFEFFRLFLAKEKLKESNQKKDSETDGVPSQEE